MYVGCELTISSSSTPSLSSSSTGTAFESKILLLIYDGTCSDEAPNEAGYLVGSGAPEAKPVRCVVGVAISIQCMASQLAAPVEEEKPRAAKHAHNDEDGEPASKRAAIVIAEEE